MLVIESTKQRGAPSVGHETFALPSSRNSVTYLYSFSVWHLRHLRSMKPTYLTLVWFLRCCVHSGHIPLDFDCTFWTRTSVNVLVIARQALNIS